MTNQANKKYSMTAFIAQTGQIVKVGEYSTKKRAMSALLKAELAYGASLAYKIEEMN